MLGVALQMNLLRVQHELPALNFQYIRFCQKFTADFIKPNYFNSRKAILMDYAGITSFVLYYLANFGILIFAMLVILYPDLPCLLTSLDMVKMSTPRAFFTAQVIQYTFLTHHILSLFGTMYLYAFTNMDSIFLCIEVLQELRLGRREYKTVNDLRTEPKLMKNLRALQILLANSTDVLTPIALPANKWLFLCACVYFIYGAIRISGLFALLMFAGATLMLVYLRCVFAVLADIPACYEKMLRSWMTTTESREMKGFLRIIAEASSTKQWKDPE
ncbi:unnamed protein product [Allacma fusca]|uniref:Uncharacterized protein n=1 Tax=Allacma fusca TaxID=39272 RepID=A0A8J2J892_9HEXA|nr:unnamed protein product [Allacma fusca]